MNKQNSFFLILGRLFNLLKWLVMKIWCFLFGKKQILQRIEVYKKDLPKILDRYNIDEQAQLNKIIEIEKEHIWKKRLNLKTLIQRWNPRIPESLYNPDSVPVRNGDFFSNLVGRPYLNYASIKLLNRNWEYKDYNILVFCFPFSHGSLGLYLSDKLSETEIDLAKILGYYLLERSVFFDKGAEFKNYKFLLVVHNDPSDKIVSLSPFLFQTMDRLTSILLGEFYTDF